MYKIIGNDGKTYGPISADQIRQWIAQGRADSRTAVIADGAGEWTFLGLLPEFARELAGTPPVMAPPKIGALPVKKTNNFATAGFVCGLISLACCCGCPFNVLGLIFSIVGLLQISSAAEKQEGQGFAIAGLICSGVSLLFSFGFGLLELALSPAKGLWHVGHF